MSHRMMRRLLAVGCTAGGVLIPAAIALACVTPTLWTTASSGSMVQGIHDVATLSGGNNPKGTISWNVYSTSDTWCKKPLNNSPLTEPVDGNGTYTSPTFYPPSTGSYQWVASYSSSTGENYSVSSKCKDSSEISKVSPASPTIVTTASPAIVGGSIQDSATLSGGYSPTGTISWNVYKTSDGSCSSPLNGTTPLTVPVSGDGTYLSPDFTPSSAGSYQWVATYSGDGNNNQVVSPCNDSKEVSNVSQATPAIGTTAVSGTAGKSIHDVATLSGGYSPTGTISWNVYSGSVCSSPLNATPLTVPVNGDGMYTSPDFTPSSAGSYQWVATYSGDGNNASVATQCNDANEVSTVSPPPGPPPTPGIHVLKLQRVGSTGAFTTGTVTAKVGQRIEYEILVTNTGNEPLALTLSDAHCDAGTVAGPSAVAGGLSGDVLSPGAEAEYTCSHVLSASDPSVFTNTATVTGQPPTGPPVSGNGTVSANKQAVSAVKVVRCGRGMRKESKRRHGKTIAICAPKRRVKAVVVHRRHLPPSFTG